jgi:hypothetical protein
MGLGVDAAFLGSLLDLLAMLVRPGQKENAAPFQPLVPGKDVGGDGGVGMADMRDIIDVVDRRCDVEESFRCRMRRQ